MDVDTLSKKDQPSLELNNQCDNSMLARSTRESVYKYIEIGKYLPPSSIQRKKVVILNNTYMMTNQNPQNSVKKHQFY